MEKMIRMGKVYRMVFTARELIETLGIPLQEVIFWDDAPFLLSPAKPPSVWRKWAWFVEGVKL